MWKKFASSLVLAFFLFNAAGQALASEAQVFDKSGLNGGVVKVNYDNSNGVKLKFMVKNQDNTYYYDLLPGDSFPLQLGNGSYTVAVLENVEGNKYRVVEKTTLDVQLKDENQVFLSSVKLVNWNEGMEAVKKAKELTKDAKTDMEKVVAVYDYITENVVYDDRKFNSLGLDYVPSVDEVFAQGTGICYDYAALFAAMLRSVDVPVKLVMGHAEGVEQYHAWNQVYLQDQEKWVTVDTTYDSSLVQSGMPVSMEKESSRYQVEKTY